MIRPHRIVDTGSRRILVEDLLVDVLADIDLILAAMPRVLPRSDGGVDVILHIVIAVIAERGEIERLIRRVIELGLRLGSPLGDILRGMLLLVDHPLPRQVCAALVSIIDKIDIKVRIGDNQRPTGP